MIQILHYLLRNACPALLMCGFSGAGPRLGESHAAVVKHAVITIEKAMGRTRMCLQLTIVIAAKQTANAHLMPGLSAKVAGGR